MNKITAFSLVGAAAALALSATAATAQPRAWMPINQRQAQLEHRIDAGVRNGSLTRVEARSLRGQYRSIARLEAHYRMNGLSRWERTDLDRRFDRLSSRIHDQRHDNQWRG